MNRRDYQLKLQPLCESCLARGLTVPATTVDHVEPHRGNWAMFVGGKLASLCQSCHGQKLGEQNRGYDARAVGDDGWPTDERHPANRHRQGR
jgi:hypothetical protein